MGCQSMVVSTVWQLPSYPVWFGQLKPPFLVSRSLNIELESSLISGTRTGMGLKPESGFGTGIGPGTGTGTRSEIIRF